MPSVSGPQGALLCIAENVFRGRYVSEGVVAPQYTYTHLISQSPSDFSFRTSPSHSFEHSDATHNSGHPLRRVSALYPTDVLHYSPMLPKLPSDGSFRSTPDHFPSPHELSATFETYHRQSDGNPRASMGQTHHPHPSVRGSWDDSLYNTRSESSSRSSWRGDSTVGQRRSWGPSYSDQGVDSAYGTTGHVIHEDQQFAAKLTQLTQRIDQLREHLLKVEGRTSALEETLTDGKANDVKKCGGSKAGSNNHPLLKVSRHR